MCVEAPVILHEPHGRQTIHASQLDWNISYYRFTEDKKCCFSIRRSCRRVALVGWRIRTAQDHDITHEVKGRKTGRRVVKEGKECGRASTKRFPFKETKFKTFMPSCL